MIALALALLFSTGPRDSDDDLRLAVALARRGWIELAEELCDRVRTDPVATPKSRAELPLVLAEVGVEKARRATTPAEAARLLDVSIAALKGEPGTSLELRSTLGWVLGQKAKILVDAADREEDSALEAEAARALSAVVEFQKNLIAQLEKMPSSREVDDALTESRFACFRAMLDRARRQGIADPERRTLLKEAMDGFIGLEFDLSGLAAWDAQVDEGRCLLELAAFPRAEAKFQGVVDLRKLLPARMGPGDPRLHLLERATLGLLRSWLGLGNWKSVVDLVDRVLAQNPALQRTPYGLSLELEKASALQGLGQVPAALGVAMMVDRADPAGALGREARSRMRRWGGRTPEVLLSLAEADLSAGRARQALSLVRSCQELLRTPQERAAFLPKALFKEGECHRELGQTLEAVAAFEQVFRTWPAHDLATRAGIEAARGMAREAFLTGAASDWDRLEGLLAEIDRRGIGEDWTRLLSAEMAEAKGRWREAAELYGGIGEKSEYFARSMVSSAHCYRRDAAKRWTAGPTEPSLRGEIAAELGLAEKSLRKLLGRTEAGPLSAIAWRELAGILLHETIGRPGEALECLARADAQGQDGEGRLRTQELAVEAHLALGQPGRAAEVVAVLLKENPEAPATARACRSTWRALDHLPAERRRTATLARRWLDLAKEPSAAELMEVADVLYRVARDVNGFGEAVQSFADLEDRTLKDRGSWEDAAVAHRRLVELRGATMDPGDRLVAELRWARSLAFLARDEKEWEQSKARYDALVGSRKLVGNDGQIDLKILQAQPSLLSVYMELGEAYYELGKRGQRYQFENAVGVFSNVLRVLRADSASWWRAKYRMISSLYDRGGEGDLRLALVLVENLERTNPGFDGQKFGMKPKFETLRDQIRKVAVPGK
jgi:tetratricopeptide (TPR) repeat protein